MKYASASLETLDVMTLVSSKLYLLSLCCFAFQAIVWQQALRHYNLSFAYPFMSLVNFLILLSSFLLFHEVITINNIIGVLIITFGTYYLTREGQECT